MSAGAQATDFEVGPDAGRVDALLQRPVDARSLLVLAHGAGAGMEHRFMVALAGALERAGIATLRYNFPYMQAGRRGPDRAPRLQATVRAAVEHAHRLAPDLPLLAGGKSMGGRMTSRAAAEGPLPGVCGLVFFGFPLHPAGKPDDRRAEHLQSLDRPLLFLQGTRDRLADLDRLRPICQQLGTRATLHVVEGADHSFQTLKRSGRDPDEVLTELAETAARWTRQVVRA